MRVRSRLQASVFGLLAVALVFGQAPSPFAQTVLSNFDRWDADHDGALEPKEVAKAALDSKYHGEDAAALAALHTWLSATKDVPALTKPWFQMYQPSKRPAAEPGADQAAVRAARKAYEASPASLQGTYTAALRRIRNAQTFLYNPEGPSIGDIRQGALGDCFFLAPLGAVVHRNPEDVRRLIKPTDGGFLVQFGDGKAIKITPPTDAEIGMGGATTAGGFWVRAAEKAFGSRNFADGQESESVARDNNRGGNTGKAGTALTGHKFTGVRLIANYQKEVPDTDLAPILERLRKELPSALDQRRLVLASTPNKGTPISITPNHAYAIFAFDPTTDRITLWNPHGDNFAPKGAEGFEFGFARRNGEFSMPLRDFIRTFSRISFEQAE